MMRLAAAVPLLVCAGCATNPEVYPPPVQRNPALIGEAPKNEERLLNMSEPETDAHIVRDIPRGERGPWRWTGKRPTVRIYLTSIDDFKVSIDYSVAEATFRQTGPVTLRVIVNEHPLGEARHDKPGSYKFEKAVPVEMLKQNADNDIAVEIDKPFIAPGDGATLGFILTTIGFTP